MKITTTVIFIYSSYYGHYSNTYSFPVLSFLAECMM